MLLLRTLSSSQINEMKENISGAHGAHIKSDPSISDATLFTYLRENTSPCYPHHGLEFL
jgi:hypothetical protein